MITLLQNLYTTSQPAVKIGNRLGELLAAEPWQQKSRPDLSCVVHFVASSAESSKMQYVNMQVVNMKGVDITQFIHRYSPAK